MPALIRMYVRHVAVGLALGGVFTGLLLWFNIANLWHLVSHTSDGLLAAVLLTVFNGIVFSGVQFGIAVMRMANDDGDGGKPRRVQAKPAPVPAPVPLQARGTRRRT